MKNLIFILGLGIGINSFSQENSRGMTFEERIFNRIECDRTFGKCFFPEYLLGTEVSRNNGEYKIAYYDFDHNNVPEVIAFFKKDNNYEKNCEPIKTANNATIVMVDQDNDGMPDIIYSDLDGDGFMENLDKFYTKPKIEEDFEDKIRDVEDIYYRT